MGRRGRSGRRIDSEQRVRRVRENIRARLMGCRFATASEYYRSIYSTIRQDATRRSSAVTLRFCYVRHLMVEQDARNFAPFLNSSHLDFETRAEYRCRTATIHVNHFERWRRVSGRHENSNPRARRRKRARRWPTKRRPACLGAWQVVDGSPACPRKEIGRQAN